MQFEIEGQLPRIQRRHRGSAEMDALLSALQSPGDPVISVPVATHQEAQRVAMRTRAAAKSQYGFDIRQRVRLDHKKLYLQRVR